MSPERKRLLMKIRKLQEKHIMMPQSAIAAKLGVTVGTVAGILRDSSEAKRVQRPLKREPQEAA
jgi:DNA-binding MarR family transcriptional regulator